MPPSDPTPPTRDHQTLAAWLDQPLDAAPGIGPKRRERIDAMLGADARRRGLLLTLPRRLLELQPVAGAALTPDTTATFRFRANGRDAPFGRQGRRLDGHVDAVPVRLVWFKRPPARLLDRIAQGPALLSGAIRGEPGGGLACPHPRLHKETDTGACLALYGDLDRASSRAVQALVRVLLEAWPDSSVEALALRDALATLHGLRGGDREAARRRLAGVEWQAFRLELDAAMAARTPSEERVRSGGRLAAALERNLPFTPTPSQRQAQADIRADRAKGRMTRLLNGDVGTGKTLVAALAVADVVEDGRQALVLAPSESLAHQHAQTFDRWLRPLGVEVGLLTGSVSARARRPLLRNLESGRLDVLIGTHALLTDTPLFRDLGLAVVDEQQRFGVRQRAQLAAKGLDVHHLALSATPIPRTLALVLEGSLAVSRLAPRPGTGANIVTRAIGRDRQGAVEERLVAAIGRGERTFWVCPRIDGDDDEPGLLERCRTFEKLLPERVGCISGRCAPAQREQALEAFRSGARPLLVATTVIEVGIDVPDASIIVVESAERFGLAQLHQLRGRVGRGGQPASCVLLHASPLAAAQHARLDLLRRCHDGLELAEADLAMRGSGDLLGLRQSGGADFLFIDPAGDAGWLRALPPAPAGVDPRALFPAQPTGTGGLAAG